MNPEQEPNRNDSECPPHWRAAYPLFGDFWLKFKLRLREQTMLFEAFWVAVSFHVLLFPLIWFMGWALPWPKAPGRTIVIELNLEDLEKGGATLKPQKIQSLYETKFSEALRK